MIKFQQKQYQDVPSWMTEEALQTLAGGYLIPGETPLSMWERVAEAAAFYLNMPEFYEDLLECLYSGYIGLSTPVAANFGRAENYGLPVSCFANHVADNIPSIYSHLKENAALSKYGGGTASYLGDIRPSGAPISGGGTSTGLAPWAKQYDLLVSIVSQGKTRRGSTAIYLPIDHPDLLELLRAKKHTHGDPRSFIDCNLAVTITDKWMISLLSGDKDKKAIFDEVLKTRMISGSPYLIFIDNANRQNPESYVKNNLSVKTSNLCCLTGDTLVHTKTGERRIDSLVGKTVEIFDGEKYVPNSSFVLVEDSAPVYEIVLNIGTVIKATHNHRWFVERKGEVHTEDLRAGDILKPATCISFTGLSSIKIVKVTKLETLEPVYCTKVESTGMFALSCGVMTGNSEIFLYTDDDHTFVCVLSSLNLLKYPEWKNYVGSNTGLTVPEIAIYLLDTVIEEFIQKSKHLQSMGRARRFSIKSRALGLGTMGLAALYQKLGIPFASPEARKLNIEIHREIQQLSIRASKRLADLYGEPEWCKGTSMRNTHLTAIAPTRTNSVICSSVSQGVEPIDSNYYTAKQSKGTFVRKNPILENTLNDLNQNTYAVWKSILDHRGSVQHLDFLSDEIKNVFKTAREIDQFEIIKQAEDRQKYICQGQSINLFVDPHCSPEYLYKLHLLAWKVGLKSLYYLRNNSAQLVSKEKIDNFTNGWIIITSPTCSWCAKVKALLTEKEFNFKELSVSEAKKHNLWKDTWTTVPKIIYNDDIVIESYDDLVKFFAETESDLTINTINQCSINECSACEA